MNLDAPARIRKIDSRNMLAEIDALPAQLEAAWKLGQSLPLLPGWKDIRRVVLSGMGGSAIGADLLAAWSAASCPVPVIVHRDYNLPAWARGSETLVVASSHSGETEETLDSFEAARQNGCRLAALCTGGELARRAASAGVPVWQFAHAGQPRAAVGWSFGLLLAFFARLKLIPDPAPDLLAAAEAMRSQQASLRADVPTDHNPAKRMARQVAGHWVNLYASGILAPVARRWKGQVNELAKAGAGFELLPEADHNALAALLNPKILGSTFTIFLRAPSEHPRNRLRSELTERAFHARGRNTEVHLARGEPALAQMWTALHFGDYMAFYLAMLYGMDPTPVEALENFKSALK